LPDRIAEQDHAPRMLANPHSDSRWNPDSIGEISLILAAGLQRLLDRKSSRKSASHADSSLDCESYVRGHVPSKREGKQP
jgi:hypothetical protein